MCADVIGCFGIIAALGQPLLDGLTRGGRVIAEAASEAEDRATLVALHPSCERLCSSNYYLAVGARTKAQLRVGLHVVLQRRAASGHFAPIGATIWSHADRIVHRKTSMPKEHHIYQFQMVNRKFKKFEELALHSIQIKR